MGETGEFGVVPLEEGVELHGGCVVDDSAHGIPLLAAAFERPVRVRAYTAPCATREEMVPLWGEMRERTSDPYRASNSVWRAELDSVTR
jgi:hypothetical protein